MRALDAVKGADNERSPLATRQGLKPSSTVLRPTTGRVCCLQNGEGSQPALLYLESIGADLNQ